MTYTADRPNLQQENKPMYLAGALQSGFMANFTDVQYCLLKIGKK